MVGLCTVLIMAVHSVTKVEFQAGNTELDRTRARLLGESAVAVALSQLARGTTESFSNGVPKPWTSQPGALRVHDMSGTLQTIHKLYSASDMAVESEDDLAHDLPANWQAQPEAFVDLNVPRRMPGGALQFPIVDPRAMSLDPTESVEGFSYDAFPGAKVPDTDPDQQRLAMPVRWLYVLQDGTLATMNESGLLVAANNTTITGYANPVVGRVAFWVDDETCKINVNTASEGAFWDTPRADTLQERSLATHQPSRLEYQRQPGHPAGVCFSSVLLPGLRHYPRGFLAADSTMPAMEMEDVIDLWHLGRLEVSSSEMGPFGVPSQGTSFGGMEPTDWEDLWSTTPMEAALRPPYATAHEIVFGRQQEVPLQGGLAFRSRHDFFVRHPEAITRLARSSFFLTASSSAPETTLFGTPRIAMWPVHAHAMLNRGNDQLDDIRRDTAYDRKVLFSSVFKGRPWFVQRSEPGNGMKDFKVHANGDNEDLFEFLRRQTSRPVPGFYDATGSVSTFEDKYEDDRDAILLQMMDYIRSTNFADGHLKANNQFSILCPGVEHHGFGQVSPLQKVLSKTDDSATLQGQGRFLTVSEVALIIVCRAEVNASGQVIGTPSTANRSQLKNPGDRELEVGVLVEAYVPGQGWADYRPWASVSLVGGKPNTIPDTGPLAPLPPLKLNGIPLVISTNGTVMESADAPPAQWNVAGGPVGLRSLSEGILMFRPVVVTGGTPDAPPPLHFEGASNAENQLRLAVYDSPSGAAAGKYGKDDLVQVIPLVLPDIPPTDAIVLPKLPADRKIYPLNNRWKDSIRTGSPVISPQDIVQSLAPIHGDYRLLASQRWADSRPNGPHSSARPLFVPHTMWGKIPQAHSLRDDTLPMPTDNAVGYVKGLHYSSKRISDLPSSLVSVTNGAEADILLYSNGGWVSQPYRQMMNLLRLDGGRRGSVLPYETGDFDNGIGAFPDGPGTNRPDDGHWAAARMGKDPYFDPIPVKAAVPPVSLATFSAQRLLPSPVKFGSLPTGSRSHVPWQTLLFRPNSEHYGASNPPDHLLLDFFNAPVLEPQPLTQGFQTEGKINLNHRLVPFGHIHRATALHAAMKAETMMAIPDSASSTYKTGENPEQRFRRYIDARATLELIDQEVFDQGRVFLTAGQLCEHHLIPDGVVKKDAMPSKAVMKEFWKEHRLTGDNSKEQPYAHLYSRLTTRSNTYKVHFIAQSLRKAVSTRSDTFDPSRDRVLSTFRGSCTIRRHIDPEQENIPDYLTPPTDPDAPHPALDKFASWHVSTIQAE